MTTLPGLPQPAPDPQPDATPLDNALADLHAAAIEVVIRSRSEHPDLGPADVAARVFEEIGQALDQLIPAGALRTGMLDAFERTHPKAMTFIDVAHAKTALERLADNRRREVVKTEGGIIISGKD